MQIGFVGLGKMGYNLVLNLHDHAYEVVAYDVVPKSVENIAAVGVKPATSLADLCQQLTGRKVIWLMVPAGKPVDDCIEQLLPNLNANDIVIDGGNSNYKESIRRYNYLKTKEICFLDCGTSGGMEGARHGACTMVGGDAEAFAHCENIFKDSSVQNGYLYAGAAGAGHFVKMVHNGIEYGMMQAIAEGFEVMERSDYDFDLQAIAKLFNNGSVVRSWLMELMEEAFSKDPKLAAIRGVMHSSGEGRWTLETALDMGIATPVIALSLLMRYRSQQEDTFSGKVVAALRNEFGGHAVEKAK